MNDVRELLKRGSEKVIAHYVLLLANAKSGGERELYRSRIEGGAEVAGQTQRVLGLVRRISSHHLGVRASAVALKQLRSFSIRAAVSSVAWPSFPMA
jgi:hypothetical protein